MSNLTLNCIVYGDGPGRIFQIKIAPTESVSALRKSIKEKKKHTFCGVDADCLKLWKVTIDSNDPHLLNSLRLEDEGGIKGGVKLNPTTRLSKVFTDRPKEEYIHIVVIPSTGTRGRNVEDPMMELTDRRLYLNQDIGTESLAIGLPGFRRIQADKSKQFLCNRPDGIKDPVPVILLERIFAEFVDECEKRQPTVDDYVFVKLLSEKMRRFYDDEDAWVDEFRHHLHINDNIPLRNSTVGPTKCKKDEHMMSFEGRFPLVIVEEKNEALVYYRRFLKEEDISNEITRYQSIFPSFHILIFGGCISISGSVFPGKIHSDILAPIIPMFWHETDLPMLKMAARIFGALRSAIDKLKALYLSPFPRLKSGGEATLGCPYPRSYNGIEFSYDKTQPLRDQLIFFGETCNDEARICIKFARNYSREAHDFCASKGCAPKLISYEELPGGWNMVVMEALKIDITSPPSVFSYRQFSTMVYRDRQPLQDAVTSLIHELHDYGYVHGDLRDSNLFAGGKGKFVLVDFDWAGPIGHTHYPLHVNRKDICRPDGAVDLKEILKEHDLEMLTYIFPRAQCTPPPAKRQRMASITTRDEDMVMKG